MEKDFLRKLDELPAKMRAAAECALRAPIVLADPMDLTKMMDVPPGPEVLPGVASMLKMFYV